MMSLGSLGMEKSINRNITDWVYRHRMEYVIVGVGQPLNIKTGIMSCNGIFDFDMDFRLNSLCAPRTGLVPLQRGRFCNHAVSRQTTFTRQGYLPPSSFYTPNSTTSDWSGSTTHIGHRYNTIHI